MPLLDVKNLSVHFHTDEGVVRAVDDLSFSLEQAADKTNGCSEIVEKIKNPDPARLRHDSIKKCSQIWTPDSPCLR